MKYITKTARLLFVIACATSLANAQNRHAEPSRTWQGIPGLERTEKGRIFISWFSGGPEEPDPENEIILSYSDDSGRSFTTPRVFVSAENDETRFFDPGLWIDPNGRLWLIYCSGNKETAAHTIHARICENPDASSPVFGESFQISLNVPYAFRLNKPTVLSTGEWIMPVTHAQKEIYEWFAGPKQLQGVAISTDEGMTWNLHGALNTPPWALECMVVELKDGRLWLLNRTGDGVLWESLSSDKGLTWTDPTPSSIPNPGARFFIRRLQSGNLLLVNQFRNEGRKQLEARISSDDGKSWHGGLMLDERNGVSYPDGIQDETGLIWIVYDRDRKGDGEILLAKFREEDVVSRKNVSGAVELKRIVNKLEKPLDVPNGWNPKLAGDQVMKRLVKVTAPQVKGAHDGRMVMIGDYAYIVYMANDVRPSEDPNWPEIYSSMSIVNLKSLEVENILPIARTEQAFANVELPSGSCFAPHIIQKDPKTLRAFFSSENPGKRQSQTWYRDFDLASRTFAPEIHKAKLKTVAGTFDMEPGHFYTDAVAHGFTKDAWDSGLSGLYTHDSFKKFDGKTYVTLTNFPGRLSALAQLRDDFETFEVIAHYNEPQEEQLNESSVNRLPDGTWMAIIRNENGNYRFTTSRDGRSWNAAEELPIVPNGTYSKSTFDRFGGIYYLGWQEDTKIDGVYRSVFNIDVSPDGKSWQRKYRFESTKSFQYPFFLEHMGTIWLCVTQGDSANDRKERIMFGKLEETGGFNSEIFPISIRGKGMSISSITNWLANFVVELGGTFTFGVLALMSCIQFLFSYKFLKETKVKALEKI